MADNPLTIWRAAVIGVAILVSSLGLVQDQQVPAGSAPIEGQLASVSSPEGAFARFMDAMREGDWAGCSRMMHTDALVEFHSTFSSLAQVDESGEVARMLFGLERGADVAELSPQTAFEKVMQGMMAMNPGMIELFGTATAKVLGSVTEGDVEHVVYRVSMDVEGASISKIAVAPFKQERGEWRALLTGDMQGMIQAIQRQVVD